MEEIIDTKIKAYQVSFEIEYKAEFGQTIFIVGNIEELGHWKKLHFELKWHEGNIWKASTEVKKAVFLYKYILVDKSGAIIRWEKGYNRLVDLELAELQGLCEDGEYLFKDKWERFNLVLKLLHPFQDDHNRIFRVGETIEGCGTWSDFAKPVGMERIDNERLYSDSDEVCAYQVLVPIKQQEIQKKEIVYMYSIYYPNDDVVVWEREPSRKIIIEDPEEYLKNDSSERYLNFNGIWQKEKSAYIVNGYLFKKDSNLITNFNFDEIPGYGIAIGPYPQTINDVEKLSNYGVKSVFCVQSKHDFHHRGINIENKRYIIKF